MSQYYLYFYQRKSPMGVEKKYYLQSELISGTSQTQPKKVVQTKSFEEFYELKALISFKKGIEREDIIDLLTTLKKPVVYNGKAYYPEDYQTKLGNEISAHKLDYNSCRTSSRRTPLNDNKEFVGVKGKVLQFESLKEIDDKAFKEFLNSPKGILIKYHLINHYRHYFNSEPLINLYTLSSLLKVYLGDKAKSIEAYVGIGVKGEFEFVEVKKVGIELKMLTIRLPVEIKEFKRILKE